MTTDPGQRGWTSRTLAAQALGHIDEASRAVVPPIHLSTTFIRDPDNQYRSGNIYSRPDNVTVREAEAVIAALEGAASAMMFGSGMSAATALFLALSPGDHVVAPEVMYWSLRNWLMTEATRWGLTVTLVDMTDLAALRAAIVPGRTRLVWAETPSNPLWSVTDIAETAAIAHQAGAVLAVDSTCATPILTRPLSLGADIVMHSATKYLNGHSDVLAGALASAREDGLWERVRRNRSTLGQVLAPLEAFLLIRGMRTLPVRVAAACGSAMTLAERLSGHAAVSEVLYPGLAAHPGHEVARRQMEGGFGGMLSIRLKGGERAAIATAARVELWKRATSLGGVESLIEHRASIEGAGSPCPPDLLRLSTGIEDPADLYADLDRALRAANA
ncbi:trans-sulfuration enzyme family protein [Elioraea rosea]|uniref:trans-sulfuration enzyme family protein n=1 Tax=Elioraea rosea TaxID=2492390 RepID=UPI0011840515|nr:aminotransferase class I/II-fold pyridoxal phosphate-dependent enzyme [Elioraea rosea]